MKVSSRSLASILCFVLCLSVSAFAQYAPSVVVPPVFTYGGTVLDNAGKPFTGVVGVTFSLYTDQQGGSPLWIDSQNVQVDTLGRYSVELGAAGKSLPVDLFSAGQPRWLGVQTQDGIEVQQRVRLVSVPYALKAGDADTIGGKPASAFVLVDSQSVNSSKISAQNSGGDGSNPPVVLAIDASSSGTPNRIGKWITSQFLGDSSTISEVNDMVSVSSLPTPLQFNTAAAVIGSAVALTGGGADGLLPGTTLQLKQSSYIGSAMGLFGGDAFDAAANSTSFSFNSLKNNDSSNGGKYGIVASLTGIKENTTVNNLAGALAFSTHASNTFRDSIERMRIDSNGNVGIATTTPGAKLAVNSLPSPFQFNSAGAIIGSDTVLTGGGSDGNLPGTTLQIKQSSAIGSALALFGGDAFNAPYNYSSFSFNNPKNNDGSNGGFYGIVASITGIKENTTANNLAGGLAFSTHANNAFRDSIERVRIDSNGFMGIGTTTPTQRLDVIGTIKGSFIQGDGSALTAVNASNVTCSSSCISTTEIADGSITAAKLLPGDSARTRGITYLAGCETCTVLADTDDQPTIYYNVVGPMDIVSIVCFTDTATAIPTIHIQRVVGNGAAQNVMLGPLTCNGTAATTFSIGSIGKTDKLDFVIVTAGGNAKRVTVAIETRVN